MSVRKTWRKTPGTTGRAQSAAQQGLGTDACASSADPTDVCQWECTGTACGPDSDVKSSTPVGEPRALREQTSDAFQPLRILPGTCSAHTGARIDHHCAFCRVSYCERCVATSDGLHPCLLCTRQCMRLDGDPGDPVALVHRVKAMGSWFGEASTVYLGRVEKCDIALQKASELQRAAVADVDEQFDRMSELVEVHRMRAKDDLQDCYRRLEKRLQAYRDSCEISMCQCVAARLIATRAVDTESTAALLRASSCLKEMAKMCTSEWNPPVVEQFQYFVNGTDTDIVSAMRAEMSTVKVGVSDMRGLLVRSIHLDALPRGDGGGGVCNRCIAVSPDGHLLAIARSDGTLYLFSLPDGELVRTVEAPTSIGIRRGAYGSIQKMMFLSSSSLFAVIDGRLARIPLVFSDSPGRRTAGRDANTRRLSYSGYGNRDNSIRPVVSTTTVWEDFMSSLSLSAPAGYQLECVQFPPSAFCSSQLYGPAPGRKDGFSHRITILAPKADPDCFDTVQFSRYGRFTNCVRYVYDKPDTEDVENCGDVWVGTVRESKVLAGMRLCGSQYHSKDRRDPMSRLWTFSDDDSSSEEDGQYDLDGPDMPQVEILDVAVADNGNVIVCGWKVTDGAVFHEPIIGIYDMNTATRLRWLELSYSPIGIAMCRGQLYVLDRDSSAVRVFE